MHVTVNNQAQTLGQSPMKYCPVEDMVSLISGKWKPLILLYLRGTTRRFNELQRLVSDSSPRMLALHLKELEHDGLIHREVFDQVPPKVEYSLTVLGASLTPLLDGLAKWGLENGKRRGELIESISRPKQ